MVNTNKLRGKIVECGMNVSDLAEKIGIDKATLYRKINSGGDGFTIRDVNLIARALNLGFDEINSIFFAVEVSDMRFMQGI